MPEKHVEDFKRHGGHVGPGFCSVHHMQRMAQRSRQHLCFKGIIAINRHNVADQIHADMGDVIQTAQKRAYISGPVLATSSACDGEKHKVTFTLMPSLARHLAAFNPALVVGTFTTTHECNFASSLPCLHISSVSVEVTSALTGPCTMSQISTIRFSKGAPSLAISEGLVVTPSSSPMLAASRISFRLAVSRKIFMVDPFHKKWIEKPDSLSF